MPFSISDQARFAGDFKLDPVAGFTPSAVEQAYLDTLERVAEALAEDEADDPSGTDPASRALSQERKRIRSSAAAELREQAQEFVSGNLDAEIAADNSLVIKGKYVRDRDRLAGSLFVVTEKIDEQTHLASDLLISVAADLPPPNDAPTPEKQALFVALDETLTVISTVCDNMRKTESSRADRLLDQYVRKLAGIGRLGLQGSHVALGNLALAGLRDQFVAQEAGRIKNKYIQRLGIATGIAALLSFTMYWIAVYQAGSFFDTYKVFFLSAGGASVGTWLSFSIRRVTLSFNELGIIEEDLLDPGVRVLFVIALTVTVCLLFWTKAMNIEIGNLKTAELGSPTAPTVPIGAIALLVGLFCGISERALATAVSGRAAAFVKGLGGT